MIRSIAFAFAFTLAAAVPAWADVPTSPVSDVPNSPAEKVKCRRYVETGSLARVREECHSARIWQQLALQGQRDAYSMLGNMVQGGSHVSDDPKPK